MYQKCKTHVQSDFFCSLKLLFCGVVVVVAVVVVSFPANPFLRDFSTVAHVPTSHQSAREQQEERI